MNVLLTSAGRRSYMVDYFKEALRDGSVFAVNSELSPALSAADVSAIAPLIHDDGYIPFIMDFCERNGIDVLVPLFDIDLPVLANNKELLESKGVAVIVSDISVVEICNDKLKMADYLTVHGFCPCWTGVSVEEALRAVRDGIISFPLMVKPRCGMGSIGVFTADDEYELRVLHRKCHKEISRTYLRYESNDEMGDDDVIIQEYIAGIEYGMDVINDLSGGYRNTIVRRKLAMRAGETDSAEIVSPRILIELGRKLSAELGHVANLDVDVIQKRNGECVVIDMNPRFGGGYPFSHAAGVNLPKAILQWVGGTEPYDSCFTARNGIRLYKDIEINEYGRQ